MKRVLGQIIYAPFVLIFWIMCAPFALIVLTEKVFKAVSGPDGMPRKRGEGESVWLFIGRCAGWGALVVIGVAFLFGIASSGD